MDNAISKLEELTETLVSHLQHISSEDLEAFLERRQQIIGEITFLKQEAPYTPDQVERLNQIVEQDSLILNRMSTLKDEASNWLQNRGQAKTQRNAYEAAYSPDSMLMDRRE
ncbi:hypothetical protein J2Z69_002826 [Paenibacillus shirakamiensis]|uniref:Flagellar protein FliT n=1 Tax=Paenibacillus shirakamiensis TaxID=1265935 RepID=A0ABS4JJ99_9BACL|nr:hypothetical protein [Paenibacillus shirakamiensis]MBP2001770.1 hypothetical protein [Paenibacillus shirakamiensis]